MLHFSKPDENKLYLFDTNYERLYSFSVYKDQRPYFLGGMESINIPNRQCIFIMGGLEVDSKAKYVYIKPKKPEDGVMDDTSKKTPRLRGILLFW